jgi:hypothetical protein
MYTINPPIINRFLSEKDPLNNLYYKGIKQIKRYKIKVREKITYYIDLHYYEKYVFLKYFPAKHESNPDKYKIIGLGLKITEVRGIMHTCIAIIRQEFKENNSFHYAIIGQPYDKDDKLNRIESIRFSIYKKQISTFISAEKITHLNIPVINFYAISLKNKTEMESDLSNLFLEIDGATFFEECLTEKGRVLLQELGVN